MLSKGHTRGIRRRAVAERTGRGVTSLSSFLCKSPIRFVLNVWLSMAKLKYPLVAR